MVFISNYIKKKLCKIHNSVHVSICTACRFVFTYIYDTNIKIVITNNGFNFISITDLFIFYKTNLSLTGQSFENYLKVLILRDISIYFTIYHAVILLLKDNLNTNFET